MKVILKMIICNYVHNYKLLMEDKIITFVILCIRKYGGDIVGRYMEEIFSVWEFSAVPVNISVKT